MSKVLFLKDVCMQLVVVFKQNSASISERLDYLTHHKLYTFYNFSMYRFVCFNAKFNKSGQGSLLWNTSG